MNISNLKKEIVRNTEIMTDGVTVWINVQQGLIGRLGPRGIDVHSKPGDPAICLDCGRLPEKPWERFVESMKKYHSVALDQKWQPKWSIR